MTDARSAVHELRSHLVALGWVTELLVAGSLATGDHVPGVSDLDLVALVDGPVDPVRLGALTSVHRGLDSGCADGLHLGCVYVDRSRLPDPTARHPTWTHGSMVSRALSAVTRAELVQHGYAVLGRPPLQVLPPMDDEQVRAAARAELTGYWSWAVRRPALWLDPVMTDLSLTSMARGRHTMATGRLITKTRAIDHADAPAWLVEQLRDRRRGEDVVSPRLRAGHLAWRDALRTTTRARRDADPPG